MLKEIFSLLEKRNYNLMYFTLLLIFHLITLFFSFIYLFTFGLVTHLIIYLFPIFPKQHFSSPDRLNLLEVKGAQA